MTPRRTLLDRIVDRWKELTWAAVLVMIAGLISYALDIKATHLFLGIGVPMCLAASGAYILKWARDGQP